MSTMKIDEWVDRRALIATELQRFVQEFRQIRIRVQEAREGEAEYAFVHPPFMLQQVSLVNDPERFGRLKERHRARLLRIQAARAGADTATGAFLRQRLYDPTGKEKLAAGGRATLSEIQEFLQDAVDQGLIPPPTGLEGPTASAMRAWLKQYGIGVDCSAFVQQALTRLTQAGRAGPAVETRQTRVPFLRSGWVYEAITSGPGNGDRTFEAVPVPALALPGDIMTNGSHMRILVDMEATAEGVTFELAESISATDLPAGSTREEPDIGPRTVLVHYPHPTRTLDRQQPGWKRPGDPAFVASQAEGAYLFGRCRLLRQTDR